MLTFSFYHSEPFERCITVHVSCYQCNTGGWRTCVYIVPVYESSSIHISPPNIIMHTYLFYMLCVCLQQLLLLFHSYVHHCKLENNEWVCVLTVSSSLTYLTPISWVCRCVDAWIFECSLYLYWRDCLFYISVNRPF